MFFDHGNLTGALFGLLLLLVGVPPEGALIGFAYAWLAGAFPDIGPLFKLSEWKVKLRRYTSHDWGIWFESGDWLYTLRIAAGRYRLRIVFVYDWARYTRLHKPTPAESWWVRNDPFMKVHRAEDVPAHSDKAFADKRYRTRVYIATAVPGWGSLIVFAWKVIERMLS